MCQKKMKTHGLLLIFLNLLQLLNTNLCWEGCYCVYSILEVFSDWYGGQQFFSLKEKHDMASISGK